MFQYLNHDNRWPRFRKVGLEVEPGTGALTLRRLPGSPRDVATLPGDSAAAVAPAGLTCAADGTIFATDPDSGRVFRIDPCTGEVYTLSCVGGPRESGDGWEVGQLDRPRGVLFQSCRNRLLVADSGNDRILAIDVASEQVVAVWGQPWPYTRRETTTPPPPRELDGPTELAQDAAGNVYVVDQAGGGRLHKFDADGHAIASFGHRLEGPLGRQGFKVRHVTVAAWPLPGEAHPRQRLVVLGRCRDRVVVYLVETSGDLASPTALALGPHPRPSGTAGAGDGHATIEEPFGDLAALERVRGFTALGGLLLVGLAGKPESFSGTAEPDRVWAFEAEKAFRRNDPDGTTPAWLPLTRGNVAALAVRGSTDDLLIHGGPGRTVVALSRHAGFRSQGAFLAGPFLGYEGRPTPWQRVKVQADELPAGCQVQFFTLSDEGVLGRARPPRPQQLPAWFPDEGAFDLLARLGFSNQTEAAPPVGPQEWSPRPVPKQGRAGLGPGPTAVGMWYQAPQGQFDFLARNSPGDQDHPANLFWIAGFFKGDGGQSPRIHQVRLEYDEDGWLSYLPAYYQRDPDSRAFLGSLLALLESVLGENSEAISELPARFNPDFVRSRGGDTGQDLTWLAGCLSLTLPVKGPCGWGRPTDQSCAAADRIATAFAHGPGWFARRGSAAYLRRLLWLETGIWVQIDEPAVHAEVWSLGASALGTGTQLAAAAPAGAILDRTDVLGQATLLDADRAGAGLFDDLAHHFVVRVCEADLAGPEARAALDAALSRRAPAHCTWSVQVIEPRLRVGFQARLGIDAVVGPDDPALPWTAGEPSRPDTRLAGAPGAHVAVGVAHLGTNTYLT